MVKLALEGSHKINETEFCLLYEYMDKQQRKALILNFTKMKNEDEFVMMDEKELFKSFDFTAAAIAAPTDSDVSIELHDNNA